MSDQPYELFRYHHPDGTSKDWAIRINGDGTYTKRWGKTGTRLTLKDFPMRHSVDVFDEKRAKERKGYKSLGMLFIDDDGNMSKFPPASLKPAGVEPKPVQEEPRIYWRFKVLANSSRSPHLEFFRGMARAYADSILSVCPDCEWITALKNRYRDISYVISEAGAWLKEDGVSPLLLLMALKKVAPEGISISLSHDDGVEISDQLRLESQALSFFGTDLESVRPLAEVLGLIDKRVDLSMIATDQQDYFF